MDLSECFDQDPNTSPRDSPGIAWQNEDYNTERSPSKRKVPLFEPEKTPCGTAPNSSKKRRPAHPFSRATPTPSHGVKMSGIFQDAAVSLEACYTSPTASSPNVKRLRMPIRQARMGPFGHTGGQERFASPQVANSPKPDSPPATGLLRALTPPAIPRSPEFPSPLPTRWSSGADQKELISSSDEVKLSCGSNLARPITADHRKDTRTDNVAYPKLDQWKMRGLSSVPSSLSSDCHSSHGVPVVIPIPSTSHDREEVIDAWLSEFYEPDTAEPPEETSPWFGYTSQSPPFLYQRNSPSPYHKSYSPQSPDHDSYLSNSFGDGREHQRGSISKPDFTFKRSPKRPFSSRRSHPDPSVVLPKSTNEGTFNSGSPRIKGISHPIYPILPSTDAIPPPLYRRSTPSPPPNSPRLSPQSLCPFPMCTPVLPSAASGSPSPHPSPISSLGARILPNTGSPRRKRMRVRSPSDIPAFARSVRLLARQTSSSNEGEGATVKELSPHVERYRKGQGPQPERRPSYWDCDILGARANGEGDGDDETGMDENKGEKQFWDGIRDGREVMGESEGHEELTKGKTSVGGLENVKSGLIA